MQQRSEKIDAFKSQDAGAGENSFSNSADAIVIQNPNEIGPLVRDELKYPIVQKVPKYWTDPKYWSGNPMDANVQSSGNAARQRMTFDFETNILKQRVESFKVSNSPSPSNRYLSPFPASSRQKLKIQSDEIKRLSETPLSDGKVMLPVTSAMPAGQVSSFEKFFECPISNDRMKDPVVTAVGQTYERSAIESWFNRGHKTDPATNILLPHTELQPNMILRNQIEFWNEKDLTTVPKSSVLANRLLSLHDIGETAPSESQDAVAIKNYKMKEMKTWNSHDVRDFIESMGMSGTWSTCATKMFKMGVDGGILVDYGDIKTLNEDAEDSGYGLNRVFARRLSRAIRDFEALTK